MGTIKHVIQNGRVAILDIVLKELKNSNSYDPINKWLDDIKIKRLITCSDSNILIKYSQVLEYVKQNKCYQNDAYREWSQDNIADAWLIAVSSCYNFTLITFE